ncbi:histidine--tRNA ligase [Cysteiniphilum halobium]|uniref:histidine--tRNA ligase n=1 Tax=Cysteiniphilum halobium TaxID=2219059 RepID=UPI000E6487D4|nr:histidine--tRNA ligase [Cysteiniphilum halobium]
MSKIQAVRGMNDILPRDIYKWHFFESAIKQTLHNYGYQEIRLPIIEKSELFHRGVGAGTDIVEKETYDFSDRNNEALTLRPEGTAGCVRAMIEHGLLRNQIQKVWYTGAMFRYERPQKGRYRQFYQLGVEVYGNNHIAQDAEVLSLSWQLWQALGLNTHVTLELNNLGSTQNRSNYVKALVNYLTPLKDQLDEDSQRRLGKNPLRILDSKNENTQQLLDNAPDLHDFIDEEIKQDFNTLINYLSALNIPYRVNTRLVRGIDYYCNTVFEWVTDKLGAQGTICAGGRYDSLVSDLQGPETPAVGFAMGIERIILLLETLQLIPESTQQANIYVISDELSIFKAMPIIEKLRKSLPHLTLEQNTSLGSFKSQFKKADKSGAALALVIAEDEINNNTCVVKFLREDKEQVVIQQAQLVDYIQNYFVLV